MEQVVIEATRENLVKLATQARQAESRFYQRYNELSTKRDYAINCRSEAPTGSRFKWDYCQPVFQDKAQEAEGRAFFQGLAGTTTPGAPACARAAIEGLP